MTSRAIALIVRAATNELFSVKANIIAAVIAILLGETIGGGTAAALAVIPVGVVLAQGLFYSLRHFFTGVMMLIEGEEVALQSWTSFHGLLFLQALQLWLTLLQGFAQEIPA